AYINEMNKYKLDIFEISGFPFWFQEGLPEFESVGGKSVYNNMFIQDLVINDKIYDLSKIGNFYAYREGESFLNFVCEKYGRQTVMDLFYATRIATTMDAASKKVFDMDFDEIQDKWKIYLKKKYFPLINKYEVPTEVFYRLTDHKKDGSFINCAPRFSPLEDNDEFLYFSNKKLKTDIWKASILEEIKRPEKIVNGETTGKFEEFHFQRNNVSWFPDGESFAFASKTTTGDKIYVMNFHTKNIYIYEIDSGKISPVTSDDFFDFQPRWSPDDEKIVFASERNIVENNAESSHIFGDLSSDIFYYDLNSREFYQVTNDDFNNDSPFWDSTGQQIIFISEKDSVRNFEVINTEKGRRAQITKTLSGVFAGDIDCNNEYLIFSCFFNEGWDIYCKNEPLRNLKYYEYHQPEKYAVNGNFTELFKIDRYKRYGKVKRKFKKELPTTRYKNYTTFDFGNYAKNDSLNKEYNRKLDEKPKKEKVPVIKPYKAKFFLDGLWGGMAYSSTGETYGQINFSLSDLMGNHLIGTYIGITRELKNSDFILNYLYLARRIDYGFGGFYLNNETIYKIYYSDGSDPDYYREKERDYGVYTILRYPFSRFWRIDLENTFYKHESRYDWWDAEHNGWIESWMPPEISSYFQIDDLKSQELVYSPQINIVHDNAIYGEVGPISGWRGFAIINRNFSKSNNYSVFYLDVRNYLFFAKRYSFAARLLAGIVFGGDTSQNFGMEYYNGVRGVEEDLQGKKKVALNYEFRFPFVDNLQIVFPLPLWFQRIRGSAFVDVGAIWDENNKLQLIDNGTLRDMKLGFGAGPRVNLGYFVLKLDVSWSTNLKSVGKPVLYFSLMEDF
ncbi:MAG: hypothetical protein B6D62_02390, partial [Candidatus Cloacimonas sp. 4484_275]